MNVIDLKDAERAGSDSDIVKVARENGEGWTEYRWINPVSNKVEPKLTYVNRDHGRGHRRAIGIYK